MQSRMLSLCLLYTDLVVATNQYYEQVYNFGQKGYLVR